MDSARHVASFSELLACQDREELAARLCATTADDVRQALARDRLSPRDYLSLLAPAAREYLEPMAQRAHRLTRQHMGTCMFLFTPLYISNYCVNRCRYCAFAGQHRIQRRHLELPEIEREAAAIAADGIRHILLLTGESRRKADPAYLKDAVEILARHFSSIGIEVYPLHTGEYRQLVQAGVDLLTIYQETYERELYAELHEGGPKADFDFRLAAPERACEVGIRGVAVGALLGLAEPRIEAFLTGLHADFLQNRWPEVEVSASFPRLRPFAGSFAPRHPVDDPLFVQLMLAFRLFLPRAGITLSTREPAALRDRLVPLGVTRMSAGVSTAVGGHGDDASTDQFEIADTRSVAELRHDLAAQGYQAVMHDWNQSYLSPTDQATTPA